MSPGRLPSARKARAPVRKAAVTGKETLILDPAERKAALLRVIAGARRRLVLSLFRCDDFTVLDALAGALERGCEVEAILTKRAKGGKKRLKKLWGALEEMGAIVTRYGDPVVKYHAKYVVADEATAIVTTLNPTRKCFSRTWDAVLVTEDASVVRGLLALFRADTTGAPLPSRRPISRRLIIGPERSRAEMRALIAGARHSIRILDHKLSDPDLVGLLRERRNEGITVSVIGKQPMGAIEPHGKMMIIDEQRAVLGSTALSTLSLDFRREVSVVIHQPALVKQLNMAYQALSARAGAAAAHLPGDRNV
ncbi:MAG: phospholipase D-like domain-containing protein [Acidobacteriota bacterium]|nr:phospholipase D-like domain-containing protein [Acidobacteriota bacterium]MDP2390656.1 phospholipase D-like domain-containing protein [Acidobacteriota bacterium]MDP3719447.1 phospholipase D-like domain-containing protein [Acidobacteriota bacterium]